MTLLPNVKLNIIVLPSSLMWLFKLPTFKKSMCSDSRPVPCQMCTIIRTRSPGTKESL